MGPTARLFPEGPTQSIHRAKHTVYGRSLTRYLEFTQMLPESEGVMRRTLGRWRVALVIATGALLGAPGLATAADGATACATYDGQNQAGEVGLSAGWERGARATIEGQLLTLCQDIGTHPYSGSFQWAAVQDPYWSPSNIVQVGYGRCIRVDNYVDWGTQNCNGSLYWYWAWGSYCGSGDPNGSGGVYGAIPLRIGSALSAPPATKDYYVLRENVGGTYYYDAYVDGVLLQGTDALGNTRTARIAASSICWDADTSTRSLAWFGETFNDGDSMGGWNSAGVANHLDYTSLRYSINTGWLAPSMAPANSHCNVETTPTVFTCKIASSDDIYIDTISR